MPSSSRAVSRPCLQSSAHLGDLRIAISTGQPTIAGEIAQHGEIARRVPRRDPLPIGGGLEQGHAMFCLCVQRQREG